MVCCPKIFFKRKTVIKHLCSPLENQIHLKNIIYISCSNGIFVLDENTGSIQHLLKNRWVDRKIKRGFYGIRYDEANDRIIVAARARLKLMKYNKPTTDALIFQIDPKTQKTSQLARVQDVHDLHQIAINQQCVYLSDTGKNRVIEYDLNSNKKSKTIQLGSIREDIHHINSLLFVNKAINIALNNSGEGNSEILVIPIQIMMEQPPVFDGLKVGTIKQVEGVQHMHDIKYYKDQLLTNSSKEGSLINASTGKVLAKHDLWTRGITVTDSHAYLGGSQLMKRQKRHSTDMDGFIMKYSLPDFKLVNTITLKNAGQVNDIIHLKEK